MTSIFNTFFEAGKINVKHGVVIVITAFLIASLTLTLPETVLSKGNLASSTENRAFSNGRTIVVPDDFEKIQDAINNASDGDTVLVKTDLYNENVVVNKSVHLIGEDRRNTIIDGGGGDVITIVASNTVVSGFTIQNVDGCWAKGIKVSKANNSVIYNNVITGNLLGVKLGDRPPETSGNAVIRNNITKNRYGVFLAHSRNCIIESNIISDSGWNGIEIDWGEANIVCANNISNSVAYGLEIPISTPSYRNVIYHNNFVNNTQGCTCSKYENNWDNGYPSGGNFWSDYTGVDLKNGPSQSWLGCDGVGDTPYTVDQSMKDRYPLMGPIFMFNADEGNVSYSVSVVNNSTVSNFCYESASNKISFQVNGANGTFGFCRICIPHGLMTEPYNVTVDGCTPIFVNYTLSDNSTHRWIYFTYQHSTHEVIIVPEFSMMITLFLVVLSTVTFVKVFSWKFKKASS